MKFFALFIIILLIGCGSSEDNPISPDNDNTGWANLSKGLIGVSGLRTFSL